VEDDGGHAVAGGEGQDQTILWEFPSGCTISNTNGRGLGCSQCVSSKEVVAGLLGCTDGGQHTEHVACQHDVAGLAVDDAQDACIGDEFDQVHAPHVLGDVHIIVVRHAVCGVVDVLED